MNHSKAQFIFVFAAVISTGCSDNRIWPNLGYSEPPPPAEGILISNAQYNKPYKVLGPVEYTLKTRPSVFSSLLRDREQATDLLKQQTYARYGDEVDAIIDTRVQESSVQDNNGKLNIVHIEGLAISFLEETYTHGKPSSKKSGRYKTKSAKRIMVFKKNKQVNGSKDKPATDEVEITPEEILK
jgi:hypothetical protein